MEERIEKILEQYIRPLLRKHNGDVVLKSFKDGVVEVEFLGACCGCPASRITLEDIVESELKQHLPEVKRVTAAQAVSDEMIAFARQFLGGGKTHADRS